jgi:acid stress chaperone HdeB
LAEQSAIYEYTAFCNGPGDVKSPRVIVASPSSRFCPWSTLRPPHCAVRGSGEPSSESARSSQVLATHAQVTVDVTKVNCDQFVHHKISEPRLIAAWLSGYYNAKRNNRVIDLQALEENMSKVTNYCSDEKNFKVPVMKAVEQVLGKSN